MSILTAPARGLTNVSLKLTGWKIEGTFPTPRRYIVVGAPHTSWYDFPLTLALMGRFGMMLHWMGKEKLFRGPLGPVLRVLGGFPVDRSSASGVVDKLVERFQTAESLVIAVAPEGTRKRTERWRSGFYRLALAADVPVVPVRVEAARRVLHIGPAMKMTGDPEKDIAAMAEFYQEASGVVADRFGPVRWE